MCYILCTSNIVFVASDMQGGLRGGAGATPLISVFPREMCHIFWWFFSAWFFPMVFYFLLSN
jgi:hypothetical protein